jgi:hypothetical protein
LDLVAGGTLNKGQLAADPVQIQINNKNWNTFPGIVMFVRAPANHFPTDTIQPFAHLANILLESTLGPAVWTTHKDVVITRVAVFLSSGALSVLEQTVKFHVRRPNRTDPVLFLQKRERSRTRHCYLVIYAILFWHNVGQHFDKHS